VLTYDRNKGSALKDWRQEACTAAGSAAACGLAEGSRHAACAASVQSGTSSQPSYRWAVAL
jgi:hypothetical protein